MAAAVPETRPAIHDVAFERLYRRYVKDVYRYTLALLQNPADAEDVTQTTFLNAWGAYRRGVEPQKPHNWLIKIAHNAARTRYAVSARRPHEVAYDEGVHELPVSAEDAPDLEGVLQSLAKLPFNQRAALVMRELEGRSYSEIADALEVSVSAVETLIFRARRSLRLHRSKLRVLGAVQLPPSLATFFENGGGAVVGGGALVGSGLLAKAAVVIATGIAAGGVGYGAVQAADHRGSGQQSTGLVTPSQIASTTFSPLVRLVRRRPHERGQGDRRWRALHLRAHERGRGQMLGRRAHWGRASDLLLSPGRSCALVVPLHCCSRLRAGCARRPLGAVEGARDPRLAPRARDPAPASEAAAVRGRRSGAARGAQPGAPAERVAGLLRRPGDAAEPTQRAPQSAGRGKQ